MPSSTLKKQRYEAPLAALVSLGLVGALAGVAFCRKEKQMEETEAKTTALSIKKPELGYGEWNIGRKDIDQVIMAATPHKGILEYKAHLIRQGDKISAKTAMIVIGAEIAILESPLGYLKTIPGLIGSALGLIISASGPIIGSILNTSSVSAYFISPIIGAISTVCCSAAMRMNLIYNCRIPDDTIRLIHLVEASEESLSYITGATLAHELPLLDILQKVDPVYFIDDSIKQLVRVKMCCYYFCIYTAYRNHVTSDFLNSIPCAFPRVPNGTIPEIMENFMTDPEGTLVFPQTSTETRV